MPIRETLSALDAHFVPAPEPSARMIGNER